MESTVSTTITTTITATTTDKTAKTTITSTTAAAPGDTIHNIALLMQNYHTFKQTPKENVRMYCSSPFIIFVIIRIASRLLMFFSYSSKV